MRLPAGTIFARMLAFTVRLVAPQVKATRRQNLEQLSGASRRGRM
jgi:hypothetical protein